MEQQEAGIELFICIPIHNSDPLFLRAMQQRSKGEDFRSIKRRARLDRAMVGESGQQADCVNEGATEQMGGKTATCSDDMSSESKDSGFISSPSSSSLSSSSLSSSVSDLFTFDEKDDMEFIDERRKPRFRLLTELY